MANTPSSRLWGLPESIGKLAGLSELIVSSNELTTLPDYIGRLTNLQALDLSSNRLTSLASNKD
ncbi:MAG: leucine-rich repeat domain-containing protein [Chloroflexi bacterium]|nr:leucine-rich repeat domain-containing protein [Chloroflexota bacterium]MCI0829274.1 leucine-rich repeat domain-containing protein [Chloroflexota bacterium]